MHTLQISHAQRFAIKFMSQLVAAEEEMGVPAALPYVLQSFGLDPAAKQVLDPISALLPKTSNGAWFDLLPENERSRPPTREEFAAWLAA